MQMVSASMRADTQRVEGFNKMIQLMSKRAPNMRIPLASARLSLKTGRRPEPSECCSLVQSIAEQMYSAENAQRFGPLHIEETGILEARGTCEHQRRSETLVAAAMSRQLRLSNLDKRASKVYMVCLGESAMSPAFTDTGFAVSPWTYFSCEFCACGATTRASPSALRFSFDIPLIISTLLDVMRQLGLEGAQVNTTVIQYSVSWTNLQLGRLLGDPTKTQH